MMWNFDHKVLIQGIDQPKALTYLQESNLDNLNFIAGVADEYVEINIKNIPVFDLVTEAIATYPEINTTIIFSHSYNVLDASYEAIDAGIKQIIINSENIPPLDLVKIFQKANSKNIKILGTSQAGILIPEKLCCGVRNADIYQSGNVGIINYGDSIISYELALLLQKNNLGESIIINLGNANFIEINWELWLNTLNQNDLTKVILISISDFSTINKEKFITALEQVKNKPIILYFLDPNNLKSLINNGQAKIITDQIPQYLNQVLSLTSITESLSEKGVIITHEYQKIPTLINLSLT
ncbi:hypothetical protein [Geminocystis sp. GBBB08]|uniref:hypothetical protein n=1 Tax=Geminocystis sp. GBBB08 TaxID=2604140 RepID=UPI0027E3ADDD|nr:hypothetical protein [Geminocystis sp. GBBB08]MBL1210783.1 hypothetical protein [Geminocystis sp. GBBB08]